MNVYLTGSAITGTEEDDFYLGEVDIPLNSNNQGKIENVFIHSFLDGRDTSPKKGIEFVEKLSFLIKDSKIRLATVMGRYYSMDRDMRWDRIKLAYDALVRGKGVQSYNLHDSIKKSYDKNVFDEFILPTVGMEKDRPICKINDGDVVFTYNFRSDRMRQLTSVLTQKDYTKYQMKKKKLAKYSKKSC